MTEFEKMISGMEYHCLDDELRQLRAHARLACAKYNTHPSPGNMKHIKRLFRQAGQLVLEPGFQCDYGVNIELGHNFYANFHCVMLDAALIKIGDDVLLGPGVHIYTVDHPKASDLRKQGVCVAKPVHIGHQVWIGGGAKVLAGVTIGDGAIIGANAVVRADVAAHSMVLS
ncbi:MAG: sugar O-acetyltransferase [Mariprofundaceae bacterium]